MLARAAGATFVGKGDNANVQQMVADFEWIMRSAVEQARLAQQAAEFSISRSKRRWIQRPSEAAAVESTLAEVTIEQAT